MRRPAAARKWWSGELARRANADGVELADAARDPGPGRGAAGRWSTPGRSPTRWPGRCSRASWPARASPAEVVAARGLEVVSDDGALGAAVDRAIAANPDVAEKIRDGKVAAAGALIGAVMKEMRGQADAARVRELVLSRLAPADDDNG